MKKVSCDPMCGFMVQSHDEGELIEIVSKHTKKSHNMSVSDKDIRGMMQPV